MIRRLGVVGLLSLGVLASGTPAHARVVDRVAAVVGPNVIFLSEVEERAAPVLEAVVAKDPLARAQQEAKALHDACEDLVSEMLVRAEAERAHITVSAADIDTGIDSVAKTNGMTRDAILQLARDRGWNERAYRTIVAAQLYEGKLLQLRHADTSKLDEASVKLRAELRSRVWIEVRLQ
jgi:peptidyl-prolyl cis-trans isomerase SurA